MNVVCTRLRDGADVAVIRAVAAAEDIDVFHHPEHFPVLQRQYFRIAHIQFLGVVELLMTLARGIRAHGTNALPPDASLDQGIPEARGVAHS